MSLLGIDLGSSVLKATLIEERKNLYLTKTVEYGEDWIGEKIDYLERNVQVYWEALKQAVKGFLSQDRIKPEDIEGISFSIQGETFVVVDENFRPLRKAIQGHDVRAKEEVRIIREKFGDELLYPVSGQPRIDGYWVAVKLLWIKRIQPEIFARTRYVMMLEDYILHKLTGRFVSDRSLIGNSYLYDMRTKNWYVPMLDFLELSPGMLPEVVDPCQVIGTVTKLAAEETGLSTQTQVVAGVMDQVASAVGAGNVVSGIITETTGTSLAIAVTGNGRLDEYVKTHLPIYYHALKDSYFLIPWMGSGGLTFQWFKKTFPEPESTTARQQDKNVYDVLTASAAKIPAGCDGLIMLPFLVGAACPEFDPTAKGVFFGINAGHTKAHFVRAILEAIAFSIRANLEMLKTAGIKVSEVRSMGGGAKSPLWNQIKADIFGVPVHCMAVSDTASLGAALIAGVGTGIYDSIEQTRSSKLIKLADCYQPNAENHEVYNAVYEKYRLIYDRLKGVF